ncbi:MAG: DUF3524 domain-containing protein [Anaerolineae bacterium]|nr:DUF3524 domain-containing protein [Anaerolineae bacterium]
MRILLLSPYHSGSHQAWAEGYTAHSRHTVDLLTLPGRFWKWRMHGGAVTLARHWLNSAETVPDIIMADDMLDLSTFLALTRSTTATIPTVLYMHENQLTYPLPADGATGPMRRQHGERDLHYVFINYASMLAADEIWFNSRFHYESWFNALPGFLRRFPEYNELETVAMLHRKAHIMPVGVDWQRLEPGIEKKESAEPLILWNQRWEYDKNPRAFFDLLDKLDRAGLPFRVALCGENFSNQPVEFEQAIVRLGERIVHSGYADEATYRRLLWQADIVISTALHEFFGISIVEAIYCRTFPLLPHRLSYPELIPPQYHADVLYADSAELEQMAINALTQPDYTRRISAELATAVASYGWRNMASRYDARLLKIHKLLDESTNR